MMFASLARIAVFLVVALNSATAFASSTSWQSYCAFDQPKITTVGETEITDLGRPDSVHTGYLFAIETELRLQDMATSEQFIVTANGFEAVQSVDCPKFKSNGYTFSFKSGLIEACNTECYSFDTAAGSWVYAFAEANGNVLAATNYGDISIFNTDDPSWCRTELIDGGFKCVEGAQMLTKPRGQQFYSSAKFQGRTLVGEWPSGTLYEFTGTELVRTDLHPPHMGEPNGFEAQSMATACGSLWVGYWPLGELWRFDGEWHFVNRFFTEIERPDFIPRTQFTGNDIGEAFFGQRITAIVPFNDSLYISTSNLRSWRSDVVNPLPDNLADEYGKVYRIKC